MALQFSPFFSLLPGRHRHNSVGGSLNRKVLNCGPDLGPLCPDKAFDLRSIIFRIESLRLATEADEHPPHVCGNPIIYAEKVR